MFQKRKPGEHTCSLKKHGVFLGRLRRGFHANGANELWLADIIFQPMIDDRAKGIVKDFSASPVKYSTLVGGYVLSAFAIGVIMTTVTLVLGEAYIVSQGGRLITASEFAKVFVLIILAGIGNTTTMLFIVAIIKSQTAFATLNSIIGTLIGFMTGIYLPIGNLPEGLQSLVKIFPPSHAALMFRSVMMEHSIGVTFKGAPVAAIADFKTMMGVTFHFGDKLVEPITSISIILASAVVFYILAVMVLARKKR